MRSPVVSWCLRAVLSSAVVLSPAVAWAQSGAADLGVTVADTPDPVSTGENLTYTITVINNGPDSATDASLTGGLPPGTTFVSLTVPGGWVCVTPPVGAGGTISSSHVSLPAGLVSVFTLRVDTSSTAPNAVLTSTFSVQSSVSDPDAANGTSTATTLVAPPLLRIHVIQGGGAESPFANGAVTVRGIVTGVTSDGFFVQEEDADVDANANTSEGIFVFTSTPPPPAAAFKAQVQVSGTVAEFVPGSDPQQPPSTQLVSPTTVQLATNQLLPAPFVLAPTFPDPAGSFDQLERLEHMRVTAGSITVTGPSGGSVDEANATGTSDGRFYGVMTGIARPFREAGIREPDVPPSGSIPPIPRWDFNPERLRIASAAINAQPPLTVRAGDLVGPVTGPLDYAARAFAIYPDGEVSISVTPGALSTTVSAPAAGEITVASFNLQRFFDPVDDAYGDPVLTAAAYGNRLAKASIAIRNHLRGPDIIGVQEVEKLSVLADLANTILADGGPAYDPYVVEGNDSVGLDVGFLVKTDLVPGGQPRVSNVTVTQVGQATTWIDPSSNAAALLNERPPLVLEATVNRTSTTTFPLVAIVGHLVDLTGIDSVTMAGLTTQGDFVRRKRQAQAEFLANYVQGRLTANPGEHLVVIGDFRAFEVNDGYVDVMNVIAGTPPPDNETVIAGDGVDLVNPDLVNLVNTPPVAERYSEVHEGNARNVDHALVSAGLVAETIARRIEHPRIGADYSETERNDNTSALRVSDQDPVVAYFATSALALVDLEVNVADSPDPVAPGQNLIYTITVTNAGPDDAATASLSDTLPANTTFVALAVPGGWLCTTPAP